MNDICQELLAKYSRKALVAETEGFTRPLDCEKALMIRKRYARAAQAQVKAYEDSYGKRHVQAGRRLAEGRGLEFDALMKAKDVESKRGLKELSRDAHRDVQSDHLRRMGLLRARETSELRDLVEDVHRRDALEAGPQAHAEAHQPTRLLTDGRKDPDRHVFKPKP